MQTTFKVPLKKKRTDFSIKPTVLDHAGVGKIYHETIEESWYPQTPSPISICSFCKRTWDSYTGETTGSCNGACAGLS